MQYDFFHLLTPPPKTTVKAKTPQTALERRIERQLGVSPHLARDIAQMRISGVI